MTVADVLQIIFADIILSGDNTQLLIFGLALAIAVMAFFASLIMRVMVRYRWLSFLDCCFLSTLRRRCCMMGLLS